MDLRLKDWHISRTVVWAQRFHKTIWTLAIYWNNYRWSFRGRFLFHVDTFLFFLSFTPFENTGSHFIVDKFILCLIRIGFILKASIIYLWLAQVLLLWRWLSFECYYWLSFKSGCFIFQPFQNKNIKYYHSKRNGIKFS